jgi:MFS family permease
MVNDLHWSHTEAGYSFALLGLACGVSSPLPASTMRTIGVRLTFAIGAVLLVAGFLLSSMANSLLSFFVGMGLVGTGYSFAGNVPAVYLIAGWFEKGSAKIIGIYMMLGAAGAAFGPPIVNAIVNGGGGWRGHWQAMAIAAGVIGIICFAFVREAPKGKAAAVDAVDEAGKPATQQAVPEWTPRAAIFTPQFFLIAAAITGNMACVTTYSSMTVPHLVKLGSDPSAGAYVISIFSVTATIVKAFAGRLCELVRPTFICAAGLMLLALSSVMLGYADTTLLQYASALVFGVGWGFAFVSGTVILLDYFGGITGSRIMGVVYLLVSAAAAGPIAAGMIADTYGTFLPIFLVYTVMMALLSIPIFFMRRPENPALTAASVKGLDRGMVAKANAV